MIAICKKLHLVKCRLSRLITNIPGMLINCKYAQSKAFVRKVISGSRKVKQLHADKKKKMNNEPKEAFYFKVMATKMEEGFHTFHFL